VRRIVRVLCGCLSVGLLATAAVGALRLLPSAPTARRGEVTLAGPKPIAWVSAPVAIGQRSTAPESVSQALPPVAAEKRTALIIGINHAAGHSPLQGAVTDATMLQKALVEYGFPEANVTVLLEGEATTSRILSELDRLAARSPSDGKAVFSFAGHTRLIGGVPHFVTADGGLIPAGTIAAKLARVRAPMWVALPTCYAGGYALPGIIGPNRIATFSSAANAESYELGPSGSWLMLYMVGYGILEREAPRSVESAFLYARAAIDKVNPDREPFMVDDVPGDFVLGTLQPVGAYQPDPAGDGVSGSSDGSGPGPPAEPQDDYGGRGPVMVCSGVSVGCPEE